MAPYVNDNPVTEKKDKDEAGEGSENEVPSDNTSMVEVPLPPDGGWGWVIVFASFLSNALVDGLCSTFGVFLPEFLNYFQESKGKTALAGSLLPGFFLMSGEPNINPFGDVFTEK